MASEALKSVTIFYQSSSQKRRSRRERQRLRNQKNNQTMMRFSQERPDTPLNLIDNIILAGNNTNLTSVDLRGRPPLLNSPELQLRWEFRKVCLDRTWIEKFLVFSRSWVFISRLSFNWMKKKDWGKGLEICLVKWIEL